MKRHQQCPVCFGDLEVRRVQPCFVCGAWPDVTPAKPHHHFAIRDDGTPITLCHICWLEDLLSDQGDLKARLRIRSASDLVVVPDQQSPEWDKFCSSCNCRLILLDAMRGRLSDAELERWRK